MDKDYLMITESQIDAQIRQLFDSIAFTEEPGGLYDPLRYMIEIGGKRLRPRLCLTAYSLFADEFDEGILFPAGALEVFHSFTLMHDDIMDRSALRRGVPTVWKKWNEVTAILSGDVMLIDAYKRIAKAPQKALGRAMELFSKTAAEVCEGQQYDMEFESSDDVPMADYEKMIGLKTAVLIACSAKMGAIIADADEKACEALYRYGYELGMAFQVADDYLDAFGDEKVFGKPIGGDILNKKKSWLTIRAMEKCSDKGEFIAAFNSEPQDEQQKKAKIADIKERYVQLGVDQDARAEIQRFTDKAMEAIDEINIDQAKSEILRRFAEKLVSRAK